MTYPRWPDVLPVLTEGYNRSGEDGILRSETDGGERSRPLQSLPPPEDLACTLRCTRAELQVLMDFWFYTCRRNQPFLMRDGPTRRTGIFRFAGRPSYRPANVANGNDYIVSLVLKVDSVPHGHFPIADGLGNNLADGNDKVITT